MRTALSSEIAERFAGIALGHVTREYPHKLDHVLLQAGEPSAPSARHPVFHGSFDWHSCVHGYWLLARLLQRFPGAAHAEAIAALFDRQLTPEKVAVECGVFAAPHARGVERPYGWAWLLKLASELGHLSRSRWSKALAPLSDLLAQRFRDFLPLATYPVRSGSHSNTAFALRLATDYAQGIGDEALMALLRETATRWYAGDLDCPSWGEPGGDDFLSPTLIEAECLRALLEPDLFLAWFARFLPRISAREPATLFEPAKVSDRSDGKIAHLDGLNLSRAWCFRSLAEALPSGDLRRSLFAESAERHLAASLPHVAGDYMGEHWLASFALLALEA